MAVALGKGGPPPLYSADVPSTDGQGGLGFISNRNKKVNDHHLPSPLRSRFEAFASRQLGRAGGGVLDFPLSFEVLYVLQMEVLGGICFANNFSSLCLAFTLMV